MKTLTVMMMGLVLASTSLTSWAARDDSRHLGLCKAEIEMALGDDTRSRIQCVSRTGRALPCTWAASRVRTR